MEGGGEGRNVGIGLGKRGEGGGHVGGRRDAGREEKIVGEKGGRGTRIEDGRKGETGWRWVRGERKEEDQGIDLEWRVRGERE